MSQAGSYVIQEDVIGFVEYLSGNSGGMVSGDSSYNINIVGTGSVNVVGDAATHTLTISDSSATTFDGDSGSATPSDGVITISGGTTGLTTTASGSTVSLTGTLKLANGGTNADLTASNGGIFYSTASAGAILAGTATAHQVLMSGASTTPAWSSATYPATTTANEILYSSATNTVSQITAADNGVLISGTTGIPSFLANSGTAGYVLTANSALPPSWQAIPTQSITLDADSGTATGSTLSILAYDADNNCGASVSTSASGSTVVLNVTDANDNTFIGNGAGVAGSSTVKQNTIIGSTAFSAISGTADNNVGIGYLVLSSLTGGSGNFAMGEASLIGLLTGSNNIALGVDSGDNYTTSESNNILLNSQGVVTESNTLHIGAGTGTSTQQLKAAYICGINGVNVGSVAKVVTMASDQLGTATITAGAGISVAAGANTITISTSGAGFAWNNESTSFNAVAENGYFCSALLTATLPTAPAQGTSINFVVTGTGNVTVQCGAGDYIQIADALSAEAGYAVTTTQSGSTLPGTALNLVYQLASNTWFATSVILYWSVH